jgi:hypothetical protein
MTQWVGAEHRFHFKIGKLRVLIPRYSELLIILRVEPQGHRGCGARKMHDSSRTGLGGVPYYLAYKTLLCYKTPLGYKTPFKSDFLRRWGGFEL